ncbi:MAG: ribose 5-phosphate isomerase B [Firmicutes bacterium]|nr:ribose 5-phosphate isomerase B [Bacillota bacterium]
MKLVIGSDHNGFELKKIIIDFISREFPQVEITDKGTFSSEPVSYAEIAESVALEVSRENAERGILICGTGLGMAMTADKVPGVRAAVCHDIYSAERARKSNDAQIMTMGAQVIGPELAKKLVAVWLVSEFQGGRSAPKVAKMVEIDEKYRKKA